MNVRLNPALALLVVALSAFAYASETPAASQTTDIPDSDEATAKLIAQTSNAFVFIGDGSGVLVSADGLVLTNFHVAGSRKEWSVRLGAEEQSRQADVVKADAATDLCLLKIRDMQNAPCIKLGSSAALAVGQRVLALGDPFKLGEAKGGPAASLGVISALNRTLGRYTNAIQTDCPINPGNSGGPLLNLAGELIALNGQIVSRYGKNNTGIALAIPVDQIKQEFPAIVPGK